MQKCLQIHGIIYKIPVINQNVLSTICFFKVIRVCNHCYKTLVFNYTKEVCRISMYLYKKHSSSSKIMLYFIYRYIQIKWAHRHICRIINNIQMEVALFLLYISKIFLCINRTLWKND